MDYQLILDSYQEMVALEHELCGNDTDIALEAEGSEGSSTQAADNVINTGNPNNSQSKDGTGFRNTGDKVSSLADKAKNLASNIGEVIQKLIEHIKMMIDKAIMILKNRLKKMMMTDQGFKNKLRERERTIKPIPSLNITSYRYLDTFLNSMIAKLKQNVDKSLATILKSSDVHKMTPLEGYLGKSPSEVVPAILQEVSGKSDIATVPEFVNYLQTMYRGKKMTTTYREADLPNLIKMAEDHREINLQISKYLVEGNTFLQNIKTRATAFKNLSVDENIRKEFKNNVQKASAIFSAYHSILSYIYELKVEKSINYRVIVQKFYRF